MSQSTHIALVQLEQALNNLQNSMIDEKGGLSVSGNWFEVFDGVLTQLIETRSLADTVNKGYLTGYEWDNALAALKSK